MFRLNQSREEWLHAIALGQIVTGVTCEIAKANLFAIAEHWPCFPSRGHRNPDNRYPVDTSVRLGPANTFAPHSVSAGGGQRQPACR